MNSFKKVMADITSDSGAADTVAPEKDFSDYPIEPSPGSKRGLRIAAGSTKIANKGQREIAGATHERHANGLTLQIAAVAKPMSAANASHDCTHDVYHAPEET